MAHLHQTNVLKRNPLCNVNKVFNKIHCRGNEKFRKNNLPNALKKDTKI